MAPTDPSHARSDTTDPPGPPTDTTDDAAQRNLDEALEGLSHVAIGAQSLETTLDRIANLTVTAIPGANGVGVAMLEAGHPDTVCVSAPFVRDVDQIQYDLREGPCISAAASGRTVISGALSSDPTWPRFGPRIRELGVESVLSLPLVMPDGEVMGALNVYAHAADTFSADAVDKGEFFAIAAAVAVNNARSVMQAHRLADQLKAALTSRATIDQAIGIVMSRRGCGPDEGFATLRQMSQNQNIKLSLVAERVVEEAVRRARARHGDAQQH